MKKDISPEQLVAGDKSGIDLAESRPSLQALLREHEQHLAALPADCNPVDRARVQLDIAETLLGLQRQQESWAAARAAFDVFAAAAAWQDAVEACDVLFQCDREESLAALGNGVWLAVTFPVPAPLTVAMLQHIVDETPDDSDGAAVAAMADAGVDIAAQRPKGLEAVEAASLTHVITVCDAAAAACPDFPRGVERRHWSVPDTALLEQDFPRLVDDGFKAIRDNLRDRVRLLLAELGPPQAGPAGPR